jgi:ABC-type glycerol-3-phosphate transport system substrate-binding protein
LRLNGRAFHLVLLQGKESFNDRQVLVYLFRGEAVMTLSGNFITKHRHAEYRDAFGYFGFPMINTDQPRYEETPTDVLFNNKTSPHIEEAETFLRFIAQPEVLSTFNDAIGYISPNRHSKPSSNYFVQQGANGLQSGYGTTMFF